MAGYIYKSVTIAQDWRDGGRYRILGILTRNGVVISAPVWLYTCIDGRLVRKINSATDGSYSFTGLAYRNQGYFILSHDPITPSKNAAIADLVTPEPMP